MKPKLETRILPANAWIEDGDLNIQCAFNDGSERRDIRPGAFKKTLQESKNIKMLSGEEPQRILGQTKDDTLSIKETDDSLLIKITGNPCRSVDTVKITYRVIKTRGAPKEIVELRLLSIHLAGVPTRLQSLRRRLEEVKNTQI